MNSDKNSNLIREQEKKNVWERDTIYELPDHEAIGLGDGLIDNLGVQANDLLNSATITRQEDAVLENIKNEYNFEKIRDTFNEVIFVVFDVIFWSPCNDF